MAKLLHEGLHGLDHLIPRISLQAESTFSFAGISRQMKN
jgi:hypothetical protein